MSLKTENYIRKLDRLFALADAIEDNDEVKSYHVQYLCIKTSGLIEACFKEFIENYLKKKCPQPISNYVVSRFNHFTNADYDKLKETLGLFCNDWKVCFVYSVNDEMKASLNSVVNLRHNFAHGVNSSSNISFSEMKKHYNNVKAIINLMENIMK